MATHSQAMNMALKLVGQAADLLESVDDTASAVRLRHTLSILKNDASFGAPEANIRVPLTLMRMALAVMDKEGQGTTFAACSLQSAIDHARGAKPMIDGDEVDFDLLGSLYLDTSEVPRHPD